MHYNKNFKPKNNQFFRKCQECEELFLTNFEDQMFCTVYCEDTYDEMNNGWRRSNYENKDINDWDVDDHLAAWYDDMMEK